MLAGGHRRRDCGAPGGMLRLASWRRSWRRQRGRSIVGAMWRRRSLATLLFAGVVVLPPLAHASPPDPSWVAGFWDDADYDDIVLAVAGMTAVPHYTADIVTKPSHGLVDVYRSQRGVVHQAS